MPRRCSSLATLAVLFKLALAQLEGVRLDDDHRRIDRTTAHTSHRVTTKEASGNTTARPGSACRGRQDCPSALLCLSETCRCPELLPVLLRFDNSFACAPSRRLDERCLSHAECSHANEHARCLHSVCSCPPKFYAAKASLLCLPEYVAWHPMRRVVLFPALAILVSAFLALGGLCYSKLLCKRRRFRVRLPRRFLPTAPKDSRELRYERFLKYLEGQSTCTRLSTVSTTFRFETDYSYIEARHCVLGRKTETPERYQRVRGSPIDLHRQSSVELERKRSEGCSSSASLVRSNAVPGTGSIPSEALSTMIKTDSSMSVPHHVRRKSGSAGVQSGSSGSLSDTGALASGDSGPHLSRNDESQIQRELLDHTLSLSQLPPLSENTQVTDAAVTVAVHDMVPSHLPVTTTVNRQRPVPLPRKKIPALLAVMPTVAMSRNSQANKALVSEGAAVTSPELRNMDPVIPSSKRREYIQPTQLESVQLVHNEPMSSAPRLRKSGEPRIPNLERAVSLDLINSRLVNTSGKLSARTSRRHVCSVLALQLKRGTAASWPRLNPQSRSLEILPWEDSLTPVRDALSARPHSIEVPRPTLRRRRRECPRSQRVQRVFSSYRAASIPMRLARVNRLCASTPPMGIGQSRSLDSVLAAGALLAEKGLGSSFYSFSFTRSDCSNLPISLRSAILQGDNAESIRWPSRIKP